MSAWNRFWFGPASPLPLGLFRIGLGLAFLAYLYQITAPFEEFLGTRGIVAPATIEAILPQPRLNLLPAGTPDAIMRLALFVFWVAALMLTIGYRTRLATFACFALMCSFTQRNPFLLNGPEQLLRIYSFSFLLAPGNLPFSVDRRLAGLHWPPGPVIPLAQRLIALQVAIVYLAGVLWKTGGSRWVDGTAVYYTDQFETLKNHWLPLPLPSLEVVNLATYLTIAVELAIALCAWFRPTRPWVLAGGVLLHLGIGWNMNLWIFSFAMLAGYPCFLAGRDVMAMTRSLGRWRVAWR
ncbi:MAG: HTTM domain-containing protein [Candidatus Sericytochromatia bacterium]|nr:HTTM domain-containing protein [Candidatus Tanganyikabacteria bacterium]